MNESELRDFLPPERPLPPARRHEMKERLMATIEHEGTVRKVRSRLPVPGAAVAAGVVALAFVAGAVAILWGQEGDSVVATDPSDADSIAPAAPPETTTTTLPIVLPERDRAKPDPEDVAQVMENHSVAFESHTEGWRPWLHSEEAVCAVPEGENAYPALGFPMEQPITEDDFAQGCTQSDWMRNEGITTEGAEVCVVGEDYWQERQDLLEDVPGPDHEAWKYPVPFVALAGRSCTGEGMQLITNEDLAEINRLRAIEASVLAAPECSTVEEVERWAQAWLDEEGIDLPVYTSPEETEAEVCYTARIDWQLGTVSVALHG